MKIPYKAILLLAIAFTCSACANHHNKWATAYQFISIDDVPCEEIDKYKSDKYKLDCQKKEKDSALNSSPKTIKIPKMYIGITNVSEYTLCEIKATIASGAKFNNHKKGATENETHKTDLGKLDSGGIALLQQVGGFKCQLPLRVDLEFKYHEQLKCSSDSRSSSDKLTLPQKPVGINKKLLMEVCRKP